MANNNPSWTFSSQSSGGGKSTLFGQGTSKPSTAGIFGTASNTTGSSAPSIFGSTSTAPSNATPLFGTSSPNQGSNIFGGGGGGNAGGTSTFGAGNQTTSAGFGIGQNSQQKSPATTQTANPFGGATASGAGLFGNAAGSTSAAPMFGSSTPTSKPTSSFAFANASTTPAGPPPSNPLSFGLPSSMQQQSQPSAAGSTSTLAPPSGPKGSSIFGNNKTASTIGLFQSSQPTESKPTTTSSQPSTSIFTQPSGDSGLFGNRPEAQPHAGIFNNLGKQNDSKPPTTSTPQNEAQPSLFSNTGGQSAASALPNQANGSSLFTNTATTAGSNTSKSALSFPSFPSKPAESSTPTTTASSLFNTGAQNTTSSSGPPTAPAAASNSPFANLGNPADKSNEPAPTTSATGGSSLANAPALSNTLKFPTQASTAAEQSSTTKTTDPTSANTAAGKSNLGASTTGPAPTAQSRLKNKSMDEIITRWASDLSKYQKEFQRQAEKVATWDRMLVENSDKIQKLYGSTLEAQRATSEVERQLTIVENEQADVERELDAYESQVNEMLQGQQRLGDVADVERERVYNLAEKVNGRLEEMGKDLSSMIEEINDASSSLNKNNKPDDPLSQVVRVLNSHLTQLQQIDQGAATLQLKVAAAQKTSMSMGSSGGYAGPSSDAADGFYRSFMGRR